MRMKQFRSCANTFHNCHQSWQLRPTRISLALGVSQQKRNLISRAFARCWSCAANTADRRKPSLILLATMTPDITRQPSVRALARQLMAALLGPVATSALSPQSDPKQTLSPIAIHE